MEWHEKGGLKWLTYEVFNECPELVAATFSRHGGVSKAPYDTLNVGDAVGDDPKSVSQNIARVRQAMGLSKLIGSEQVHKTAVTTVTPASPDLIPATDGLITTTPGIGVMGRHADCQVAIFYDPIRKVAATAHSGWRGSVQNIYAVVINRLEKECRSRPENLLCAISPSLGPEEAEFVHYREELPEPFWDHQTGGNHFDFWEISYEQLIEAGLLPDHIEIARYSNYKDAENFFSYRRDKKTGRNPTLVALRP
ncbi:MAG: peptidoglycan editing factor PgeF [Parachlamydiales bacterium]